MEAPEEKIEEIAKVEDLSSETPAKEEKGENFFKEILKASLIAIIIVVPIRFFIAQPYIVSGASMDPSFRNGHYIIVDQISYRFNDPVRGEVVIFKYPKDTSKYFIKRIIGVPGDTVKMEGGVVTIYNKQSPGGFLVPESYVEAVNKTTESLEVTLGEDEYFVLGDNRKASSDSRIWGDLERDLIVGRAYLRVLPIGSAGFFPGQNLDIEKENK